MMTAIDRRICWFALAAGILLAAPIVPASAQEDIELLEEEAFRAAVDRVAASVVRIETVGGLETVGAGRQMMRVGTGPTTGLVVSNDGYIVSSAFNFVQKPTRILVGLPDGSRLPAEMVATDHNQMLTLLKIDVKALDVDALNVPKAVPQDEMQVGQWAIAVGRTFDGKTPNMSIGIVSALGRIWGKAIQTDAKISPNNYGGPLVDIRGRVLGVLVPLSPQGNSEIAGVQWYDSGIGFAVPLASINRVLDRLKKGEDLHHGIMGISFRGNQLSGETKIAVVRATSPAAKAGLKVGDVIRKVDGKPVTRIMQLKQILGPKYAGDEITVVVRRDKEEIETKVKLIDKLEAFQHPFLGVLPMRAAADANKPGVEVRYVYPDSPAAKAGLKAGDRITAVDGEKVEGREGMIQLMNGKKFNAVGKITVQRGDQSTDLPVRFAALPEEIPDTLPPARSRRDDLPGDRPAVGLQQDLKIAEFQNSYAMYVPADYDPAAQYGIVAWLQPPGIYKVDDLVAKWKQHCDQNDLILLLPKWSDAKRWQPTEVEFLRTMIDQVVDNYNVDRTRIVAGGYQAGGTMAYMLGFQQRELIRAVAAVDAPLQGFRPSENEPTERMAFFITTADKAQKQRQVQATIQGLKRMKYPITELKQGEQPHHLKEEELSQLARWIDSLDRF